MSEFLPYGGTVAAMGVTGSLLLLQLLVVDVVGLRRRHQPGTPVAADHGDFLFRATRAHANTNESIAAFVLLALFGILRGADPAWLNLAAWGYVGARVAHMLCYYLGLGVARSVSFGLSLAALLGLLLAGVLA